MGSTEVVKDGPPAPGCQGSIENDGGAPFGSWAGDASMAGGSRDMTGTAGYIPGGCMACLPNQNPTNGYVGTTPLGMYTGDQLLGQNTDPQSFASGGGTYGFGERLWISAYTGGWDERDPRGTWTGWSADQGFWELRAASDDSLYISALAKQVTLRTTAAQKYILGPVAALEAVGLGVAIGGPAAAGGMRTVQVVVALHPEESADFARGMAAGKNNLPPMSPAGVTGWVVGNVIRDLIP